MRWISCLRRASFSAKRQIRKAYFQDFETARAVADAEMKASFDTFDFKEGVDSFVETRPPAFRGA